MSSSLPWRALLLLIGTLTLCSATTIDYSKTRFISRPDLRPPTFHVKQQQPHKATPGLWFITPFDDLKLSSLEGCHTGPHIFAENGELIWSGACEAENRLSHDLKIWSCNGTSCLSYAEIPVPGEPPSSMSRRRGVGILLDNHYNLMAEALPDEHSPQFNMHEFTMTREGESFLGLVDFARYDLNEGPTLNLRVWDGGFREGNLRDRSNVFEWRAAEHIDLNETTVEFAVAMGHDVPRDWFHLNSIDKNSEGDYLISARFTNAIYKISGLDGSIIWRLGGLNSSFAMDNLTFSRQHDARFLEDWSPDHPGQEVISFLNNAAGGEPTPPNTTSGAYILALDSTRGTVETLHRLPRPDGNATTHMGNVQVLPNKHVLAAWSDQAYTTEFDETGQVVLEASILEPGIRTYRAYKFNFTGYSHESIAMKCFTYGTGDGEGVTTSYMSWNGATTVEKWEILDAGVKDSEGHLTTIDRSGFESMAVVSGQYASLFVRALNSSGAVLGTSEVQRCEVSGGGAEVVGGNSLQGRERVTLSAPAQSWSLQPLWQVMLGAILGVLIPRRGWSAIWQSVSHHFDRQRGFDDIT